MAGDPDPFCDPYTDIVILTSTEVEIEDDKEKTISIVGSSLDMDEIHPDPSQHRVHVPLCQQILISASYINVIIS